MAETFSVIEGRSWERRYSDGSFSLDCGVYFNMCGPNKCLTLYDLYKLFSDIAVEDFNTLGFSREFLAEHNMAILVSRTSFRIHKAPPENTVITIRTQEEKNEPLQFIRSYIVTSSTGEVLITGYSTWILIDIKARRILPIKKFDFNERPTIQREHDCLPCGKINSDATELLDERVVKPGDIDSNGHVNNARYAAFLFDALPPKISRCNITDVRLNYAKEALLGQPLKIYGKIDEAQHKVSVRGAVPAQDNGKETTSFEAEIYYKEQL